MNYICLWFTGSETVELLKTEFGHALLSQEKRCVRGKTAGAYQDCGSFQWTTAVKSLALFFLKAASCSSAREYAPVLEGNKGSIASSLDYALSKQPNWLLDMFGVDSKGIAIVRRIIARTNSELKREGPVALSLNSRAFAPEAIKVYWENQEVASADTLRMLIAKIEQAASALSSECTSESAAGSHSALERV